MCQLSIFDQFLTIFKKLFLSKNEQLCFAVVLAYCALAVQTFKIDFFNLIINRSFMNHRSFNHSVHKKMLFFCIIIDSNSALRPKCYDLQIRKKFIEKIQLDLKIVIRTGWRRRWGVWSVGENIFYVKKVGRRYIFLLFKLEETGRWCVQKYWFNLR